MDKEDKKSGGEDATPYYGLANSSRPLPIARIESDTTSSDALSWDEIDCPAGTYAPQYALCVQSNLSTLKAVLVNYSVQELRALPSYTRHKLSVQVSKLGAVAELGERAFRYPLLVTRDRFIVDGYERWELAKSRGVSSLPCLEYNLDERQALEWFININRRSEGLTDFTRIELALDLEDHFRERASLNRQEGGRLKGSSNLTTAEKIDSRREIARVAGVSVGNVHKVKFILSHACSLLIEAARTREVSINQAEKWSHELGPNQQESLRLWRIERGIKKKARHLVAAMEVSSSKTDGQQVLLSEFAAMLQRLTSTDENKSKNLEPIEIRVVHWSGRAIFVTDDVLRSIQNHRKGYSAHDRPASD